MKLLILYYGVELKQKHKLKELFEDLPDQAREEIMKTVILKSGCWGFEFLKSGDLKCGYMKLCQMSNAFVEWRYKYENNFSKSASKQIDSLFLQTFCEVLQEYCLLHIFHTTLEKYQEGVR